MPRQVKAAAQRRDELLDSAQSLFFEKGYETTTVNDLIRHAGLSKGGFYHHFASKDDILEALATRLARQSVDQLADVLEDPELDALARLNAFLGHARRLKKEQAPRLRALFAVIFEPGNLMLYHRLNAASVAIVGPVLARIIDQGRREGRFKVPDADAAATIILQLNTASHDAVARALRAAGTADAPAAMDALEKLLRFQGLAIDRILGLPDGSVDYVEPGFVEAVMEG